MSTLTKSNHIGRKISRIRELKDMKQEALAQAMGTNQQAISIMENSETVEEEKLIEGDIFVSIDRIKENAQKHSQEELSELSRVISHGLLHLMGYKDKTKADAELMRSKEAFAIELFETL